MKRVAAYAASLLICVLSLQPASAQDQMDVRDPDIPILLGLDALLLTGHEQAWSPLYRFRQRIRFESESDQSLQDSRLDIRTYFRYRAHGSSNYSSGSEIAVQRIDIYDDGFLVGAVSEIPDEFAFVRGHLDEEGLLSLDETLYLVGDPYVGFELIAASTYGDGLLKGVDPFDKYESARLDFQNERIIPTRRSRLFNPEAFTGFVPIELLPDDRVRLSAGHPTWMHPSRRYTFGDTGYYGWSALNDYARFGGERSTYRRVTAIERSETRSRTKLRLDVLDAAHGIEQTDESLFETPNGVEVRMKRESALERIH